MKKIFAILMTLVLFGAVLTGCSSNVDTVVPEITQEATVEVEVETTAVAPTL